MCNNKGGVLTLSARSHAPLRNPTKVYTQRRHKHVSQRIRTYTNDNLACNVLGRILGYMKNVDIVSILLGSGVITFYVLVYWMATS